MSRGYGNALTRHKISQTEQRQRRELYGWHSPVERSARSEGGEQISSPVDHPAQPVQVASVVSPLLLPATCPQPYTCRVPNWGNRKELNTPAVIALPAFFVGSLVHYNDCYISRIERVVHDLYYVYGETRPFMAWELTRLLPAPTDVCPECLGSGMEYHFARDMHQRYWNDAPCRVCGGTGKGK